ncbi:TPA: alpha/beta hydrolase family protein [Vibrio cholerae]
MNSPNTDIQINPTAQNIAAAFTKPYRTKMPKTPLDYGMLYEEVRFLAEDGLELSAWLMPNDGNKLAILNHPLYCSKYGFIPEGDIAQLVPVHVEFLKTAKHLHDAGFTVLFYDLRNHGQSQESKNGFTGIGYYEWQDAVGAMRYVAQHERLKSMDVALVSHCMGANSSIRAMSLHPELFENVKVMVAVQPINMRYMAEKLIPLYGGGATVDDVDVAILQLAGFSLSEMSPYPYLKDIKVPVLYSQVRQDVITDPADLEYIVENTPTEKKMLWIEGELNRFDGYNYYGENPAEMLHWLGQFM